MICESAGGSGNAAFNPGNDEGEPEIVINLSNAELLKLDDGYELAVRFVDIDGNKVFLELLKDGQVVDSRVIIPANEVNDTFVYTRSGTPQRIVLHIRNTFRGAAQDIITVDRIEQTSEIYPHRILLNDSSLLTIISGTPLKLKEGYDMAIKSIDIDGNKVYLELLKDGQVVDSQVIIAANEVDGTFVYSRPGTTQKIEVDFKNAFRGADQNMATINRVLQTSETDPSRILVNDSSYRTLTSRTPLKLEEGYEFAINSIDINGNKVYVELSKDGFVVDSRVIIAANDVDESYIYLKPKTEQEIAVHFQSAFRGADRNLVIIDRIMQ